MQKIGARSVVIGVFLSLWATGIGAVGSPEQLSLESIFSPDAETRIEFDGAPLTGLEWAEDGRAFLQPQGQRESLQAPSRVEVSDGSSAPLFDTQRLIESLTALEGFPREAVQDLSQDDLELAPHQDALLTQQAADLFYFSIAEGSSRRLTHNEGVEEVARFSPDGRWVSFVRDHDLYVVSLRDGRETALTRDGNAALLNGKLDWVYQEELYGRGDFKGYWWSPDSRFLAFLQLDESAVHEFTLVDHLPTRGRTEVVPYPKAGDPNPKVRLGVVPVAGGPIVWADMAQYQAVEPLIVRVDWTPDSRHVVSLVQDREQTWLDIVLADPLTGEMTPLVHETSPAFVDVDLTEAPHWLADGSFLWLSGRTGFHHIYHFDPSGELRAQVTNGGWEVSKLHGVDEERGWIYFSASEHSPIEIHAYRVRPDGSNLQRLTVESGSHLANFNPTFDHYLDTYSNVDTPPRVSLHRSDGARLRTVDANQVAALAELELAPVEFLEVEAPDGFVFEAALIKPLDFDPSKTYPVLQYNYGGPHAPTVRNAWGGSRHLWFRYLAQEGFVVWMCDNRSASGKGIAPTWEAHGRLGELELADLESCLAWLKEQAWVDSSRIGVYGGSYGGFMASFALTHSKSFKAGIAFAPVTDWRLYDSIYTERYMGRPQDNAEGYDATSVIEAADRMHGALLLIHGTMDDNVHLQNTIQLANALQQAGKDFQLMLYPNSRHGIRDKRQIYHLYRSMTRFLKEKL